MVQHQRRLVELHLRRAGSTELPHQVAVERQDRVEQAQRREPGGSFRRRLAAQQERHRPQQHRPGVQAELTGLGERFGRVQLEGRVRGELRHQLVVVRVEPLGHLQRRRVRGAPGHREVPVQSATHGARVGDRRDVPRGHRTEQYRGVQDVVVQGEVVDGNLADARVGEHPQPGQAQAPGVASRLSASTRPAQ